MPTQYPSDSSTPFPSTDGATSQIGTSTTKPDEIPVVNRVTETAHATIDKLAEKAAPQVDKLSKSVTDASELLRQSKQQAVEKGTDFAESVRCTVREKPLAAIGTAFLLGLLMDRWFR